MTEDDDLQEIRHGIRLLRAETMRQLEQSAKLLPETMSELELLRKLRAQTMRQLEQSGKLTRENFWYPLAIATSLVISVAAVTLLVIKASLGHG